MFIIKKQDIIGIIITFLIGFVGGAYLYLTYWAVAFSDDLAAEGPVSDFSIISESYGGCSPVCPSFQVLSDGSYRFIHESTTASQLVISEGDLPRSLLRELRQTLSIPALALQSRPIEPINCRSFGDGIDVRYTISLAGLEYDLDSCGTAINRSDVTWTTLAKIWEYLQTENL